MLTSLSQKEIQEIKTGYPCGTRVMVDLMAPDPLPIDPGTIGTVDHVDDIGQIHCTFDNGRVLALNPEVDQFHIYQPTGKVKDEWLRSCLRLTADEFVEICQELYGPQVVVHFDMDGLWIDKETGRDDDWSVDDDKLTEDLSAYFDLNVMSVFIDDENNTNVWINYVPGKSEQKVKVIAIYDYDECRLTLYADTPNVDAELIDTGSPDSCDSDYQLQCDEIAKRRGEIANAYARNELYFIAEL